MSATAEPIAPTATMPEPEWIRIPQASAWCGMCRSSLYQLINEGKVRSVSMRERGTTRGTRLISFPSLKAFLESKATGGEAQS